MVLTVRDRAWWGATAPLGPPMLLPVDEAWLHHSVTPLTDDPVKDMKAIERVGVQRFGRFSYSWAYHRPSRSLLEGAGNTIGAHTAGRNSTSLGLVLIGNYDLLDLDDEAVADLREAFAWLIAGNRLRPGVYPTGGHRDLKQTACPGGRAYARLDDIRLGAPVPVQWEDQEMFVMRRVEDGTIALGGPGVWRELSQEQSGVAHAMCKVSDAIPANARQFDVARDLCLTSVLDPNALAARIADLVPDSGDVVSAVKQALREGSG